MIIDFFPTRVGKYENTDLSIHQKLVSICDEIKKEEGRCVSNFGGFQSFDLPYDIIKETIGEFIGTSVCDYLGSMVSNNHLLDIVIQNYWLNVNGYGHYNSRHTHPFVDFSCVYYLKTPKDSGAIRFIDPNHELKGRSRFLSYVGNNPTAIKDFFPVAVDYKEEPKEGMLIVFPAYIEHEVEPNKAKDERMSLAFNISINPPD